MLQLQNQSIHQTSLYSQVTDRIIAELEQGIVPWVQPWGRDGGSAGLGLPRNARTAKAYSGINILLLWDAVIRGGYASQHWLTFKQALELGGCVRKGETGWSVCYADSFIPKHEKERASQDGGDPQSVPYLKRYLAAQSLAKEGLEVEAIPCAIMAKGDDAAAVEASLIENVHRLPMDDMDQFEAFQRLLKEGRTVEEIANTFGVTEIMVKRRLAIANLAPKIRTAYRAEEVDGETLRALTLASKQQQKDWLLLFEEPEQHAPRGGNLKRWLLGGSQIPTTNAIFDLANYKGDVVSDLFGEESYFANPDKFWTLQNEAIAKLKTSFEAHGWSRVEIMEQDQRFQDWDYEKTPKKKGGAVYISISDRGEVEAHDRAAASE